MNVFQKFLSNLQASFTSSGLKDYAYGALGGATYVIVPTAIEAWFKTNLTGYSMWLTGTTAGIFLGAAFKNPGMIAGTAGAAMAHWMYAKGNGAIIKPVFGQYAARFDAQQLVTMGDSQQLQTGAVMRTLPDGTRIATYPTSGGGVSDRYPQALPPGGDNPQLNDRSMYADSLMDGNNFANTLNDRAMYTDGLMDNAMYADALMDGNNFANLSDMWQGTLLPDEMSNAFSMN
mgnify:CR=1 FL=1